jgi:hypothetical protein
MAITLITMSVIFANAAVGADGNPSLPGASGVIALIAANLFVVSFGMSWGPVVWVLLGEMFPNRIRARGAGPRRRWSVGSQLADHRHLPGSARAPRPRLRLLRAVRGAVGSVRVALGHGDQGNGPRGHARADHREPEDRHQPLIRMHPSRR